jgi:hypothetical protein
MKFLLDEMLPPQAADILEANGHEVFSVDRPAGKGLSDRTIVEIAATDGMVIVTENWRDFARLTACSIVLVRKDWWASEGLAFRLESRLTAGRPLIHRRRSGRNG